MYGEKNLPRSPFAPRSEIGTEEQVDLPVVWVEQARFYQQELLRYRTVLVVATAWRRAGRAGQRNDSSGFPAVQYPYQGSDRK